MISIYSNNYNNKVYSFKGLKKGFDEMDKKEIVLKKIVTTSNDILANAAEKQVPENDKFSDVSIEYQIPTTQNMAKVIIECDGKEPKTIRRIAVGVHHQNSDRIISKYLYKGTKKELLNYLRDENNQEIFLDIIKELSEKTDDYYSNL